MAGPQGERGIPGMIGMTGMMGPQGPAGPSVKGFFAFSEAVTVGEVAVAVFQEAGKGAAPTAEGLPLEVNLDRAGKLAIDFSAVAVAGAGAPAGAQLRYMILVDGTAVPPTEGGVIVGPTAGGGSIATSTMVQAAAGVHRIQVVAQSSAGATFMIRNQALTAVGALD
jgi:hypothetical protein